METPQDNIWPTNIERILFHRSDKDNIQERLTRQAITICCGIVCEEYICQAFKKFKSGYYYKGSEGTILGFCIWKQKKQHLINGNIYKYMKVLLICAEKTDYKLGKMMLLDIDTVAHKNKVDTIELEAATESLIQYYKDSGYFLKREHKVSREAPYDMYKLLTPSV